MMGQQTRAESLFYYFRLEDQIPEDHLLRVINQQVDLSFVRERLKSFYSSTGRPSVDPEVLLRLLLVGYLYGITSERRLLDEVRMHLAYRWFTRLGFEQEIPDHSTFSKNRHGRFRQSGVFQEVFEEIVRRCLAVGLVEGQHLAVDGTLVAADASARSRVSREQCGGGPALPHGAGVVDRAGAAEPGGEIRRAFSHGSGIHHRSRRRLGRKGRAGGAGVLRQLFNRYGQSRHSGGRGYARALPARDAGRPADAPAGRQVGASPGKPGRRQGLWEWRVSGLVAGAANNSF